MERPFFAVPHLSTVFFAVPGLFSPVLDDFRQKREKKGRQKMEERERKERVPFQFLSRSRFFPFLCLSSSRSWRKASGFGKLAAGTQLISSTGWSRQSTRYSLVSLHPRLTQRHRNTFSVSPACSALGASISGTTCGYSALYKDCLQGLSNKIWKTS